MRYKFWSCQHIDIIESHGTVCNYLGEKPSKCLLSESMDAKRGAEASDCLTEHSDARGEAGLALGMQGKVGMVWICVCRCLLLIQLEISRKCSQMCV